MSRMFTEDQIHRLRRTPNIENILVALCLEPNVDLFEAFASPFFSGKKTSSTNRREKNLARRDIFHQICTSGLSTKEKQTTSKIDPHKKFSYLDFALHLHNYSARWKTASIDEVLSLVLLIDQDRNGFITERTIFDFCDALDNTRAMDRSNPHRITQTLLVHLIDYFHEQSLTATLDTDVKEIFQTFVFRVRHKHRPPVMVLADFFAVKEANVNSGDGEGFDAMNDFWLHQFQEYAQSAQSNTNNTNIHSTNSLDSDTDNNNNDNSDGAAAESQQETAQPAQAVESLLKTLTEFREQSVAIAEEIRASEDQVKASQILWSQLQEIEGKMRRVMQLQQNHQNIDHNLKDNNSNNNNEETDTILSSIAAPPLSVTSNNSSVSVTPDPNTHNNNNNSNSNNHSNNHSNSNGKNTRFAPPPANGQNGGNLRLSLEDLRAQNTPRIVTTNNHANGNSISNNQHSTSGTNKARAKTPTSSSLSARGTNNNTNSNANNSNTNKNTSNNNNNTNTSSSSSSSFGALGRSPLRRASSVGRMAFHNGQSLLTPYDMKQELQSPQLKPVAGDRLTASTNYLLRAQTEQLALKHGLSTKVPLVQAQKTANLSIIRNSYARQTHGNRNVFDPVLFTWVPAAAAATANGNNSNNSNSHNNSTSSNNNDNSKRRKSSKTTFGSVSAGDQRFLTPKEMQLEREKAQLLYYS